MSTHKRISFIKSGIRIVGCILGMVAFHAWLFPFYAFAFLLVAELLGILEECYETSVAGFESKPTENDIKTAIAMAGGRYLGRDQLCRGMVLVQNPKTGSTIPILDEAINVFNVEAHLYMDGVRAGSKGQVNNPSLKGG